MARFEIFFFLKQEIVGKVVMPKTPQSGVTTLGKPVTTITSNALAQSLQNLPVAQTQVRAIFNENKKF